MLDAPVRARAELVTSRDVLHRQVGIAVQRHREAVGLEATCARLESVRPAQLWLGKSKLETQACLQ